ncbi:MAG: SpoIID/LytB domain-containing protein [Pyrinomonadaceae bacterium]
MLARHSLRNILPEQLAWITFMRLLVLSLLTICVGISCWAMALRAVRHRSLPTFSWEPSTAINADNVDQHLLRAATAALGERRGTVIIMDPQTGRVRAVINSKLAFEETFRPGSTIKPFTTLAALRAGVIDEESRTLCREKYFHEKFHTTCSHPRDLSPFNPTEALAYSCNYYFGKVGERLAEPSFSSTLNEFGFGKQTGPNANREAPGRLLRNDWHSQNAIGEGDYLVATPIQLINAYNALVNGGRLFTPQISSAAELVPELHSSLAIKDEHRSLIIKGMRGAVRYGTAETASLYSLPLYIFGKTGTATEINGFRTQGWFVGFASALNDAANDHSEGAPDKVELGVLVFLAKAHGSDAAEVARPIFAEYARLILERQGDVETRRRGEEPGTLGRNSGRLRVPAPLAPLPPTSLVRIHMVRENVTRQIPLEEYVRGVLAAEGSIESEPEALKALAIASRTYTVKNIGRHGQDGYDFCTTTHCQRYLPADSDSRRDVSPAIVEATESTRGKVLNDANNQLADSYFSASCGGTTANMATLWGGNSPVYLRGVRDEYCRREAHHSWTDVISQAQLLRALRSDSRTDVGDRLLSVTVSRHDATGRAELITIEGNTRLTVKGWDFKIIVGRALGWNYLKSSRFQIARSGSDFIFRGQGFGHGLGLCQEGAHVMAARGASYRQILAKYFPSTTVATEAEMGRRAETERRPDSRVATAGDLAAESFTKHRTFADVFWNNAERLETSNATVNPRFLPTSSRRTLRSEDFQINYPNSLSQRDIEALLSFLQSSRRSLIERAQSAGVTVRFPFLEIFINETTGDFVGRTGQPAWAAAATRGSRIELQPLETLKRRRVLETTLRHELVHRLVDVLSRGRAQRWLAEGLALHLAGEGKLVARYEPRTRMTTKQIELKLGDASSAAEMRLAYAAAYGEVMRLIKNEGEASVWRRVAW